VPPESSRIVELRRRVQADPASIAFAQLAEEYRRAGDLREAVRWCRAGLEHHPSYLSARVTLGRALLDLGMLDDAARELDIVLRGAPDNLSALRARADIYERAGALEQALGLYKRALTLVRFDPYLEGAVTRIDRAMAAASEPPQIDDDLDTDAPVDFDALLASLGTPDAAPPPSVERLLSHPASAPPAPVLPDEPSETTDDPFAQLEDELRSFSRRTDAEVDERILAELEAWLRALQNARGSASPA
jgi:tetratricopeptide (TPR) repeat protein